MASLALHFTPTQAAPRSNLHRRWMTPHEALAAQGFPVSRDYSGGIPMCSFAVDRPQSSMAHRTAAIGMAGNAMHCEVVGIILLYCLTQVEYESSSKTESQSSSRLAKLSQWLMADLI